MVSNEFVFKAVIFSVAIMFLMPTMIGIFVDKDSGDTTNALADDLLSGYHNFTGTTANVNEEIWCLSGIYTPYGVGADGSQSLNYLYTSDNWLAGARILSNTPTQYVGTESAFSVTYDADDKCYRYGGTNTTYQDGKQSGDVYTSITMDSAKKSDVFFTSQGKTSTSNGFYYDFTGYRYAFSPTGDYYVVDADNNPKQVIATSTSLSLIWYEYYGQASGISGQLVLSGNDSGLAYIDSNSIVERIGQNQIAKFNMTFNGVDMNVYIKINPYFLAVGMSVAECFNAGYWSIMVTSTSTDISTYMSTEYKLNMENIWGTFVDLFTFNMDAYNLSPMMQTIASVTVSLCLYALLLSIGLVCWPILIIAGLVAVVQAFSIADIGWLPFN